MGIIFYLSVTLFAGLLGGKLIKYLKLPDVTGYLIMGLLIGPSISGLLTAQVVDSLSMVSEIALGFIAFSIGDEFKLSYFKRVGFTPIVIAIFESIVAVIFVTVGLIISGHSIPFSLVLGSIAAATAPAATIMVIRQYSAKGPVTETLLSVVALDDAVALIAFGVAVAFAKVFVNTHGISLIKNIITPFLGIFESFGIGIVLGIAITFLVKFFKSAGNKLSLAIAFVFIATAIANYLDISTLLTVMSMSAVFSNLCKSSSEVMNITDSITPPIFIMFFVLSGAELDLSILPSIGLVGVIYIVLRVFGKMTGAWFGAVIMHAPKTVQKNLGPALLPQAGVAIGLAMVAHTVVPEYADIIRAVVLCGTLIYELIGPIAAKWALTKAGEIKPLP
ncbi:MAG: cation:proton antiporter [Lachnospiraceae bacterium]|nr:cation:proton antiporter [Lachnospiraceae bacterium]